MFKLKTKQNPVSTHDHEHTESFLVMLHQQEQSPSIHPNSAEIRQEGEQRAAANIDDINAFIKANKG